MSENDQTSAQVASSPSPTNQQNTVSPTSQVDLETLVSRLVEKLDPVLDEKIKRGSQSTKDRRIKELEKGMSETQTILAQFKELREKGLSEDQAENILSTREEIRQLRAMLEDKVAQPEVGNQRSANGESRQILQKAGIPENDPDVLALDRLNAPPMEYVDLVVRKLKPKPEPTAAGISQTAQTANITNVPTQAEYEAALSKAQGNIDEIYRIKADFAKRGFVSKG